MSYYKFGANPTIPIEEKHNPLSGDWNGISWTMADTCPKCSRLNCNQLLDDNDEVLLYICPKCNHEWQPFVEIGYRVVGNCKVNNEKAEAIRKNIEMKIIEKKLLFDI